MIAELVKGTKATLPILLEGQFGFCYDSREFYVGTQAGNLLIASENNLAIPIGGYLQVDGTYEPDSTRFIKLTKDLTGAGLYNEGKLTGQSTVVTGEQTFYTAIVNDALSPKFGEVIKLVNSTIDNNSGLTAPTVISASETSGLIRHNRFQGHKHKMEILISIDHGSTSGGLGNVVNNPTYLDWYANTEINNGNGTPRTGFTTEQNNITATFYMRIL